jgi:hypothetical protein
MAFYLVHKDILKLRLERRPWVSIAILARGSNTTFRSSKFAFIINLACQGDHNHSTSGELFMDDLELL